MAPYGESSTDPRSSPASASVGDIEPGNPARLGSVAFFFGLVAIAGFPAPPWARNLPRQVFYLELSIADLVALVLEGLAGTSVVVTVGSVAVPVIRSSPVEIRRRSRLLTSRISAGGQAYRIPVKNLDQRGGQFSPRRPIRCDCAIWGALP